MAFSNDGNHIVSGSYDQTLRIWDAQSGESIAILEGHSGPVWSVAFSNDGNHIVSGSYDQTIHIWDLGRFMVFKKGGQFTTDFQKLVERSFYVLKYERDLEDFTLKPSERMYLSPKSDSVFSKKRALAHLDKPARRGMNPIDWLLDDSGNQ